MYVLREVIVAGWLGGGGGCAVGVIMYLGRELDQSMA